MVKLSYEKPSFKKYGSMKELTFAAGGSGADGAMAMSFGGDDVPAVNVDTQPNNPLDGGPNAASENDATGTAPGDDITGRPAD